MNDRLEDMGIWGMRNGDGLMYIYIYIYKHWGLHRIIDSGKRNLLWKNGRLEVVV